MGRHVFIVIEAYAEELVGDGTVEDEDLNRVLLSEDFATKLCTCLNAKKIKMLRKKIFAGTDAQIVTRLRTYMRDLVSSKHIECHGFEDTDGTRAIARWMAHRVYLTSPERHLTARFASTVVHVWVPRVLTLVSHGPMLLRRRICLMSCSFPLHTPLRTPHTSSQLCLMSVD